MKYLILLFVLFTFSTNINQKPVVASYDVEPELFWLDELGFTYEPLSEDVGYSAIYYEPISNKYYTTLIAQTNNITYNTNDIIDEQNFIKYNMNSSKMPLTYIGSINLTNRIYIDTNNIQYIKKLKTIDDEFYYDSNNKKTKLLSPVYPYASQYHEIENKFEYIFYSNKNMNFQRVFPTGDLVKIKPL